MTKLPYLLLITSVALACAKKEETVPIVAPSRGKDAGADTRGRVDTAAPSPPPPAPDAEPPPVTTPAEATDAVAPVDLEPAEVAAETADPVDGSGGDAAAGDAGGPSAEATWSHTMCDKTALMFPKIDRNNGVFPIGSCPPPENLNRACGGNSKIKVMNATAQSFETRYVHPPAYATDEYIMTRWSSNTMLTSWLQLDLGATQAFKRIYLAWEIAHATDYDVVTSSDGMTWTKLKEIRNGDGYQDILDVEGNARYVRINGLRRGAAPGGPWGYSLFDVTICGERP